LSNDFRIAETESFQKKIGSGKYKKLYEKIKSYVYPVLRRNPYFGPNIKGLKGNLKGIYRYRMGNYRLFYEVDGGKVIVFIIDIAARKDAYR
jgi:mRNA interferase RelE/StbE